MRPDDGGDSSIVRPKAAGGGPCCHIPCSQPLPVARGRAFAVTWWPAVCLSPAWQSQCLSWDVLCSEKLLSQLFIVRVKCTHCAKKIR